MADVQMIALDLDGTLLGADGKVGARNLQALLAAEAAGITVVIATGRRHTYAMGVVRGLGLRPDTLLVSSNGAVVRQFDSQLIERTHMAVPAAEWLCAHAVEFRNALVVTFDKVAPDGEDAFGSLVVEHLEDLHTSIGQWMKANAPYIRQVAPIENSLREEAPIQMMLCGTVERMRRAEARLLEDPRVVAVGDPREGGAISLNRTEYPARDLSIVDILPAGCSKGAALVRLAAARGLTAANIMACGDNWNDLSMLQIAGHPVLMGNAPEELQQMAVARGWHITATHDADGVAEAIFAAIPALADTAEVSS